MDVIAGDFSDKKSDQKKITHVRTSIWDNMNSEPNKK